MANVLNFIMAHQTVLAGLGVALLDLAFALSDKLSGNGVLHQIYMFLKKDSGQNQ